MGIDVSEEKTITFNGTHENIVDTSTTNNPRINTIDGLQIKSIFRRRKVKDPSLPDGNPLIYALKGKQGYTISKRESSKFLDNFYTILAKAIGTNEYDLIIPLPSSHNINNILVRRIAKYCNGSTIVDSALGKKSAGEILGELDVSTITPKGVQQAAIKLRGMLRKGSPEKTFSMKKVSDHRLRRQIQPFKLSGEYSFDGKKVLLVDDLLASGSSLIGARNTLISNGHCSEIDAICLFSKL